MRSDHDGAARERAAIITQEVRTQVNPTLLLRAAGIGMYGYLLLIVVCAVSAHRLGNCRVPGSAPIQGKVSAAMWRSF
jgi:hypothetical protein